MSTLLPDLGAASPTPSDRTQSPSRQGLRGRAGRVPVALLGCVILAGIIASYAGLIGMGNWQGDEYIQIVFYWKFGISEYTARVLGWSPRPISELLLWLYALAVERDHRQHIIPFLALLWIVVALATVITIRPSYYRGVLHFRLLLSLAVLVMFLLGHPISELFYWPDSSAAYLPTLAAITVVFLLPLDRHQATPGRMLPDTAALLVAAGSSEVGVLFVFCLSAVRLPGLVARRHQRIAPCVHWSAPVVLSLAVVAVLLSQRLRVDEPVWGTTPYLHRPLLSLLVAVPQTLREVATLDGGKLGTFQVATALLVRLLFFVGVRWTWRVANRAREPVQGAFGFAVTCIAAAYATLATADYQYGMLCCERHIALRQCLFGLSVAALAVGSATARPRAVDSIAPLPLVLAALIPFANTGVGSLLHDYRLYPAAIATRVWNWREGMRSDTDAIMFENAPVGRICHGTNIPPGQFVLSARIPWWARGILLFFGKREVEIRPPPPVQ